ncbi:unnamed protein product [Arabis nemorensis]|uniref:Uncharacterized protein n=1 Tax=Arabis nemorensis TaxID=586526 RepID=A0A565C207_9BRAS|nr:unnamed protein product [Arabis nemorensis]
MSTIHLGMKRSTQASLWLMKCLCEACNKIYRNGSSHPHDPPPPGFFIKEETLDVIMSRRMLEMANINALREVQGEVN